jgi:indolepyruvate ferredoxin oxidoreductase
VRAFEKLQAEYPAGDALADVLHPRVADLILYQNAAYARRYLAQVRHVSGEEARRVPGRDELTLSVARWLFKLMAVKDEYEVARLWLHDPTFEQAKAAYSGKLKRYVMLHPPVLRKLGLETKLKLGEWILPAFRVLYGLRALRGTALDFMAAGAHRRWERRLAGWYTGQIDALLPHLTADTHATAVAIARLPDHIRGYEAIKERTVRETEQKLAALLTQFNAKSAQQVSAASAA